ncbi:MAG: metal-dependent hydrolase [Chloroflexota bacterium]|nr:metal-dependent hydrolase [Chloroflexota bacterium]
MLGHTHVVGAAVCGLWLASIQGLSLPHTAALVVSAVVTSRLPDIDRLVDPGPNHRSLTHSAALAAGLLAGVSYYLLPRSLAPSVTEPVVWGLLVGYLSHLLLDSLTPRRIPLLLWGSPRVGLGLIQTGSLAERLFAGGVMVSGVVLFVYRWGGELWRYL